MVNPKKVVRKMLSGKLLRSIESEYRLARASYANARFLWPAKGMRVIMITGTNGKTTTAHYLFSILRSAGYSVGMLSTAEFRINERVQINDTNMTAIEPVLLRRYLADFKASQVDFVILEATSQALDQHRLFGIPCEVAVMTNLTQDHLDYHKTMEKYAEAKAQLWKLQPKYSILNKDDAWFKFYKTEADQVKSTIITYGTSKADVTVTDYKATKAGSSFTLGFANGKSVVSSALAGEYNALNSGAAAGAAIALGLKEEQAEKGIEALKSVSGRLEEVPIKKPFRVVVDYAHTPDGLEKVLVAGRGLVQKSGRLWLVFGACGDRDRGKRPVMGAIAMKQADNVVLTDEESYSENPAQIRSEIRAGMKPARSKKTEVVEIADRKKAIHHALENAKKGDLVLITGLGHEQYRIIAGKRVRWNDVEIVKKLLKVQ